jgi:rod shape-determining protein MreB
VLRERTGLPIIRGDDPFTAVCYGAGKALDDLELLRQVSFE